MLGLVRYGFDKKRIRTRDAKTVFLHPVGSVGHVVHSGVCRAQNIDVPVFMLVWVWCSFHKNRTRTREIEFVFLHSEGFAGHVVHSRA
jgi:hypothetical protein